MKKYIECNRCLGRGYFVSIKYPEAIFYCDKCHGTGKVDWIEQIVGSNIDTKKVPRWHILYNLFKRDTKNGKPQRKMY